MSGEAARGADSRKSIVVARPSGNRSTMKPPPATLPAPGSVTASANPIAIAASTALPPAASTDRPIALAGGLAVTTIERSPVASGAVLPGPAAGALAGRLATGVLAGRGTGTHARRHDAAISAGH